MPQKRKMFVTGVFVFCVGCDAETTRSRRDTSPPQQAHSSKAADDTKKLLRQITQKLVVIPEPTSETPIDETQFFFHADSGVKFVFPPGWDHSEPEVRDGITFIGLRNKEGGETPYVTLSWSPTPLSESDTVEAELSQIRQLYGKYVPNSADAIIVGKKRGHRITIGCGPVPLRDPTMRGVICIFCVQPDDGQLWKVKFRATTNSQDELDLVQRLSHCFRLK